jgi:predicted MFS family arabinose efflux permease
MVPEDEVQNAVTLNSALMTSSRIFGPALAGLLVVTVGFGWCFAVDATSYLAVIGGLLLMRKSELRQPERTARGKGQVREGLRYIRTVRDLWIPLMMMTVVGTLTFNFSVVLPLFAERTLHGSDGTFTILYSVLSIGSFSGALAAAHRSSIGVRDVVVACFGFGVAMLVFATAPSIAVAFPLALFVGFCSIAFMTAATAIVQVRADPSMRGRVLARQAIVIIGTTPIGGPVMGAVCDAFGARVGLVIGGLAALSSAAWGYAVGPRAERRLRLAQPTTVDTAEVAA